MKKQRYLICLLLAGMMLYYAVPRLNVFAEGLSGWFAISWLAFAAIVVAGNLSGMLFAPRKLKVKGKQVKRKKEVRKIRSFG
ncbi:hypothetical protein FZC84_17065 [Rossellomorea vietnamensis]|uniref:Uncharacterized protein n=1 Tax=Rossellomorea vietnamensis TaxID=218284 RepID=A0A5D4MAB2_9BACI|nr:hypothetical protein [Rossellomorea vietnamensis]TYR97910.1 hypothetical protein FZC84_17065 [Rossellomorea vietnamensis]